MVTNNAMTDFVLFSSHSGIVSRGSSLSPVPIPFLDPMNHLDIHFWMALFVGPT